jgi:hypothetical protein
MIGLIAWHAPHFVAVAARSLRIQAEHASAAFQRSDIRSVALAAVQMFALALPIAGLGVTLGRLALALRRLPWARAVRRRKVRVALVLAALAGLAALGFSAAPARRGTTFIADVPRRGDPTTPPPRSSITLATTRPHTTPPTKPPIVTDRRRFIEPHHKPSTTVQSDGVVSPSWQPADETDTDVSTSTTTTPTTTTTTTTTATTTAQP